MVKKSNKYFMLAVMAIFLFSCAEEQNESERSIQERILNAYVAENCPYATISESGLVLLDYHQGTGDTLDALEAGFFEYTVKSISGNYAETTDEQLAKTLGTFSNSNYYGPKLYMMGYGSSYKGITEATVGLREGGKVKFILPPWLTYTTDENQWNLSVSTIYEMELKEVMTNAYTWQQDTMKSYVNAHYPGLDTLKANFYFKTLKEGTDSIEHGSLNVRYVGRLLDGWVFDTNIADTAKKYGIYDSSNEYDALSVQYSDDLNTMVEESSLVRGFCMAIQQMKYEEEAFTMFYSEYGYGSSGSSSIGPYQPLIFWIYIEPDEN